MSKKQSKKMSHFYMINVKLKILRYSDAAFWVLQVNDVEKLESLQVLHDQVYDQARKWFQNLENRFRNQILQHFGPMPEREADIQVFPVPLIPHNGEKPCYVSFLPIQPD